LARRELIYIADRNPLDLPLSHTEEIANQRDTKRRGRHRRQGIRQPLK
jgi:hypothetical protein